MRSSRRKTSRFRKGRGKHRQSIFKRAKSRYNSSRRKSIFRKVISSLSGRGGRGKKIGDAFKSGGEISKLKNAYAKGRSKTSLTPSQRTKKGWKTRKMKYGKSGLTGDRNPQYYRKRYYGQRNVGKTRRSGKGGGFRRHAG